MKILLSYARADEGWVDELASLLQKAGFSLDRVDTSRTDNSWEAALRQQIESADIVVSVMTKHALQGSFVLFDYGAAKAARKRVIPLTVSSSDQPPEIRLAGTYCWVATPQDAAEQIELFASSQVTAA